MSPDDMQRFEIEGNAYLGPDHVASIPIDGLRTWKIREGF